MTVLHLEPEAAFASWSRIQHLLEGWEQIPSEIERIASLLPHMWEAPAAQEMQHRLRVLADQYRRTLMEALALHQQLHQEYRQWLSVEGMGLRGLWYSWGTAAVNWLDRDWIGETLETLDTFDTWKDRIETFTPFFFKMGALTMAGGYVAGLKGTIIVDGAQRFSSLGAMLDDVSTIAAKRGVRKFKDELRGVGLALALGLEVWEEVPENWDQSGGDPLRFAVRTTTETAVGLVTGAAVAGAGAWAGAMTLGAIGGAVAGPVGAVIGAKVGSTVGAVVASHLAEQFQIGGIPAGEWLEDRISDAAVAMVEGGLEMADRATETVRQAVNQVVNFFRL